MRNKAYLRVVSDEATVRAIHQATSDAGTVVMPLKARQDPTINNVWWNWETQPVPLNLEDPDSTVRELLDQYRHFFPIIRQHCTPVEADIYLEVVTYAEAGMNHRGLYLSAESIAILGEVGAALDWEVVEQ